MIKLHFLPIMDIKKYKFLIVKVFYSLKEKKSDYNIRFFTFIVKAQFVIFTPSIIRKLSQFRNPNWSGHLFWIYKDKKKILDQRAFRLKKEMLKVFK